MGDLIHLRRRISRVALLVSLLVAMSRGTTWSEVPAVDEAEIRAAMILNLTRYVEWPAWKFADANSPFVLCFLTNDPVGDNADGLTRERQSRERQSREGQSPERPITVRRLSPAGSYESCHVLYASKQDGRKMVEALPGLTKAAVLTISDVDGADGAMLALPLVNSRVQIDVNLRTAQRSGLTLSSKLLKIATVTR